MRIGHILYAATLIGLGILGLAENDFAPVWRPIPNGVPARELLVHLCALVCLAGGAGLMWRRTAPLGARVLAGYLALWALFFRVPDVARAPMSQDPWSGLGETAVYLAAAWSLYAALAGKSVRSGQVLYGLALIPFGTAHFAYISETASLVPGWLPAHLAIAYFTGFAYIAAAAAILAGRYARLAAWLSVLQMGLFTALVWVPIVMAGPGAFAWSEFVISVALTTSGWVVAESYRSARPSPGAGSSSSP